MTSNELPDYVLPPFRQILTHVYGRAHVLRHMARKLKALDKLLPNTGAIKRCFINNLTNVIDLPIPSSYY